MKVNWKKALWDRLSNDEIRKKLEVLTEKLQADLLKNAFTPNELEKIGWREACAGCGAIYSERDCGYPAGSRWRPPKDSLE